MAEALYSTSKQLCCPICLESLNSPKSLPCIHTFCEKCICKYASDYSKKALQSDTILCPVCRSPIPALANDENPKDWAAKLPTNIVVLSLSASDRTENNFLCTASPL
ncbi:hypothetical protein ACJMK2_017270 [Sinanodonta woodiana]|uniref:RING-type domain-containing protein n=1 Tax=Sinanodonta woodiana TaxID=1069815 RepID=A0ABD3UYF0_SINWO